MTTEPEVFAALVFCLVGVVWYFLKKGKGNGNGNGEQSRQVRDLWDWHRPKNGKLQWYEDSATLNKIVEGLGEMTKENIKAHTAIINALEKVVILYERSR